jgi:hypothetical protein
MDIFPKDYKERNNDFRRLLDRFSEIARNELNNQPLAADNSQLLANIDIVLEKISSSVSACLYVSYCNGEARITPLLATPPPRHAEQIASPSNTTPGATGVNFGLGGPGTLWIILEGQRGPILCCGAVYSLYETPGSPISEKHWLRKLDYGVLKPPFWCESFQLVDEKSSKH